MKIGTIAQHANIGPTRSDSIITNTIPGRLNDFPIWAWWDFTDATAVGGGTDPISMFHLGNPVTKLQSLQECDDKGPYDADLSTDDVGKGPDYYIVEGQDNYSYIQSLGPGVDYMQFTNPADLYYRNFTIIMILDKVGNTNSEYNEYLFQIESSGQSIYAYTLKNTNKLYVLGRGFTHYRIYDNFWSDTDGGDTNNNFNWIALVGQSTGKIDLYSRGKLVTPDTDHNSLPDQYVAKNSTSVILGADDQTSSEDESLSPGLKLYEMLIYEQSLTAQQLQSIDLYVKNKYSSYPYGRINGY